MYAFLSLRFTFYFLFRAPLCPGVFGTYGNNLLLERRNLGDNHQRYSLRAANRAWDHCYHRPLEQAREIEKQI